jgi:FMN-dependent dehydrogenase
VDRLKKFTTMKLVLKGIETREDARMCREHGVDGILVSNHGGRATEDPRPTIASLPEVIEGVGNQIPVIVDGGFRRGTYVYKALALGARSGSRPPLRVGTNSFRPGGRRARAGYPARRIAAHHAAMRHAVGRSDHTGIHKCRRRGALVEANRWLAALSGGRGQSGRDLREDCAYANRNVGHNRTGSYGHETSHQCVLDEVLTARIPQDC